MMESSGDAPYLAESGLKLKFSELQKLTTFDGLPRISDGKQIKKGLMIELRKLNLSFPLFYELVKSVLPLSLLPVIENINKNTLKSKIQVLEKQNVKERKTARTYHNFLESEFQFVPEKKRESPRKRMLKHELHHAKISKVYAEEKLAEMVQQKDAEAIEIRKSLETEEEELIKLEAENAVILEKMATLENEKRHLHQKIKGIKSGVARHRRSSSMLAASSSTCEEKVVVHDQLVKSKTVITALKGIKDNDIIVADIVPEGVAVEKYLNSHIFSGKKYFGSSAEHKKSSDGCQHFYVEIANHKHPCSEISRKEVQRRAKFIDDVALHVSSSSQTMPSVDEKQILYTELIRLNKDTFRASLKDAGLSMNEMLTPVQAINIQSLLRMPTNKVRNLRICLSTLKLNIFPSERKMRRVKEPSVSHVNTNSVESGFIGLIRVKSDECVTPSPFIRVKDLKVFIEEIIKRDTSGFSYDERFYGKWWLQFSGDKGGQHMKYHVEVINSLKSGSVDNVHIYCMFEATDSVENMQKVWYPYRDQIKAMMAEGFTLEDGKGVSIFLGGDYHFLDDVMGHQGSSSSYPSAMDKTMLSHLQNHEPTPHIPDTCPAELRTVVDYLENYNENLADDRNNHDMHRNGMNHYSVVGPMLFPIKSLSQVIPASLHILLGIVLLIYNLLVDECKKMDETEGFDAEEERKKVLSDEWEVSSLELSSVESNIRAHGENIVEMTNRLHRFEAMSSDGGSQENLKLAKVSDARRKQGDRRRKGNNAVEKCDSISCFITGHDVNIQWVQCDHCDKWYHTMCEAQTSQEELSMSEDAEYICLKCSGVGDLDEQFQLKIALLIEEEDVLNRTAIEARIHCDNLKAQYSEVMCRREKLLEEALECIHVVRQNYHGKIMVGNHCIIVLDKHEVLTDVNLDNHDMWFNGQRADEAQGKNMYNMFWIGK